jgi:UDP-N-acetylglucosamine/UDP-N-acetylgalactosamine diphosphorylase
MIGPGCVLGAEGPVTLDNCLLERNVKLAGGYFSGAVFLDGASFGSGAHVRAGTLLEEGASCAHTVGLKQTVLMPYATLGSLINFCDCMLSGGTGPRDHSEVGSSYIHFNFTAHQDKATPSLMGNVPDGVMLESAPIFLGGQGGLVGPRRIAFGTVVAAGTILRRDVLKEGRLVFGQNTGRMKEVAYDLSVYGDVRHILKNNYNYIANLHALHAWYSFARPQLMLDDAYARGCVEGAKLQVESMVEERIKRLDQLADKLKKSLSSSGVTGAVTQAHEDFVEQWPEIREKLLIKNDGGDAVLRDSFLAGLHAGGGNYVENLRAQSDDIRTMCNRWLHSIVDELDVA